MFIYLKINRMLETIWIWLKHCFTGIMNTAGKEVIRLSIRLDSWVLLTNLTKGSRRDFYTTR